MEITNIHYLNDVSRVEFLKERLSEDISEIPRFSELNEALNRFESNTIVLPMFNSKEEIDNILDKGILYDNNEIIVIKMQRSKCHDNVEDFCDNIENFGMSLNDSFKIINGFGLSNDGLWRFHSWILKNGEIIIETTEPRLLYYGCIIERNI